MTFVHAATKSATNLSPASSLAYTSASARSSELEANTRSLRVATQLRPSAVTPRKACEPGSSGVQVVPSSSRFTK